MGKKALSGFFVLAAVIFSLCSCGRDGKVISKNKLSKIYADMFLADQWINSHSSARRTADTTLVYGAVFEKYGCDADDYRKSVAHYMQDPDRFARILRQSALIIEERAEELRSEQRKMLAGKMEITYDFDFDRILVIGKGLPRMTQRDSAEYFKDSADVLVFDPFVRETEWDVKPPLSPTSASEDTKLDSLDLE